MESVLWIRIQWDPDLFCLILNTNFYFKPDPV